MVERMAVQMAVQMVERMVGQMVERLVGRLAVQMAGRMAGYMVVQLAGHMVGQMVEHMEVDPVTLSPLHRSTELLLYGINSVAKPVYTKTEKWVMKRYTGDKNVPYNRSTNGSTNGNT